MPSPDLCPYCGKPAHSMESNFDCPGQAAPRTESTHPPAFTPQVAGFANQGTPATGGFAAAVSALGTKLGSGTLVGEYQVQSRIGEGGMGTVYSAIHPIIGKKVAIKVLAGRLAKNKNAIRRFVLEARAVNDIRHPGLVDIFSFGQLTDGRHYYVMEFLEGKDLGAVLRERIRLPMHEAIPIFLEVGRALVAVHSKGIVHRDLKPENILLLNHPTPSGQKIKLVDFGLAKLVEGVPAHLSEGGPSTAAGVNVGTPHYMSPEQCRGMKIDARSDLYALGILLYETLTGKLPFDGPTPVDIWQAHVEKAPEPANHVAPGSVSPAMNAIILRLLAKQPEHRIQSAGDFCAALEALTEEGVPRRGERLPSFPDSESGLRLLSERALGAPMGKPGHGPGAPAGRAAASTGRRSVKPSIYDEMTTTTEDLPIVQMPEVEFTDAERRQEIEELSSTLGLHLAEPASDSQEELQMSALVIDLGPSKVSAAERKPALSGDQHSIPLPQAGKHRFASRPIEERNYIPPLAAPSARNPNPSRANMDESLVSRSWKILRVMLVVALLVGATLAALKFVK